MAARQCRNVAERSHGARQTKARLRTIHDRTGSSFWISRPQAGELTRAAMRSGALLKCCAWVVHLYTAAGAITGIIALDRIARGDFHGALIAMAVALFLD